LPSFFEIPVSAKWLHGRFGRRFEAVGVVAPLPSRPVPQTQTESKLFPRWVLFAHLVAVALLQSTSTASMFILPVLVRKRFGAADWPTLVVTSAPTIFFVLSIFWNDYFARRSMARYLAVYWLIACLPMAFVAFATNYWMVLVPHLIACVGGAGYHPPSGELFKRLYPDASRGRVYGLITCVQMIAGAGMAYGVGEWLSHDENAFRFYMPIAAVLQLAGVIVMGMLAYKTGISAARELKEGRGGLKVAAVFEPVIHMRQVLKEDPIFARYEAAYMTYGVGWMVCFALLPILVTSKLHLRYDEIAESTHVPYLLAMVAMMIPAGRLLDKLGAVRSTGVSFALLTLYPLGLIAATSPHQLAAVSVVYGIAHAGASVGWALGPVALAPTPAKVPHYVAIHASLVGLRGTVFQGLGVLLYWMTGSFTAPLAIAAGAFVWSAVQMWRLHARMHAARIAALNEPGSIT